MGLYHPIISHDPIGISPWFTPWNFSAGEAIARSTSECSSATAESPGPPWPAFRSRCPVPMHKPWCLQKGDGWAIQLSHQFRVMTWGCWSWCFIYGYWMLLGESHITSNIWPAFIPECMRGGVVHAWHLAQLSLGSSLTEARDARFDCPRVVTWLQIWEVKHAKTKVQGGAPIVSQVYLQVHLTDLWPISL